MFRIRILLTISLLLLVDIVSGQSTELVVSNFNFNFTGVLFLPPSIRPKTDGSCTKQHVRAILEIISTRFKYIRLDRYIRANDNDKMDELLFRCEEYVPIVAAEMNKETNRTKFELILSVDNDIRLSEQALAHVRYTWKLAQKANSIFPGTVKEIALTAQVGQEIPDSAIRILKEMEKIKEAGKSSREIRTGASMQLGLCESPFGVLPYKTMQVLHHVDAISFHQNIADAQYESGPQKAFEGVAKRFEKCQQRIGGITKVAVYTQWASRGELASQNIKEMITFWKLFSDWAASRQEVVYFNGAFDNLYKYPNTSRFANLGWWKQVSVNQATITKDSFVEKVAIVNENVTKYEDHPVPHSSSGELPATPLLCTPSVFYTILGVILGVLLYSIGKAVVIYAFQNVKVKMTEGVRRGLLEETFSL